jgi:uncharacterized membrane protein YkgB
MKTGVPKTAQNIATMLTDVGRIVSRYGLVVVLAWIGFGKYVKMEARVLIEHSPFLSWTLHVFSFHTVAWGLGTMEIVAAVLIAARPWWPKASAVGSALAVILFVGTLSFLFTTPGVIATHAEGIPVLSAQPGQFLLKDLVLIGVALWTLGDSLGAPVTGPRRPVNIRGSLCGPTKTTRFVRLLRQTSTASTGHRYCALPLELP